MLLPDQAFGDNCLDRVEQMAAAYGTSTDPPTIPPGEMKKPVSPDDLARSGGVVEPPDDVGPFGDHAAARPFRHADDARRRAA